MSVTVVGSGASGIHFALTLLKKGKKVTLVDTGYQAPPKVNVEDSFKDLKENLEDPAEYFLGKEYESVVSPEFSHEIYGFPPNKQYVFRTPKGFSHHSEGFEPLFSFARGGLAQAWTGGSYPYNDDDLRDYPFDYKDIEPYYSEIADRIGLIGADDDLVRFFPYHGNLLGPLQLDESSAILVDKYNKKREKLNSSMGVYLGRSRISVLSCDKNGRKKCDYSGRCLWSCPTDSLYVPSVTLKECLEYPEFTYIPDTFVTHFTTSGKEVNELKGYNVNNGSSFSLKTDKLVLAAGTMSSSKIFLDSIYRATGELHALEGLMDNRQILVPFINMGMLGKSHNPDSYQYHQLAVGIETKDPAHYIHGQITTLKTGLMQPAIQTMPLDYKTAIFVERNLHSALGVINLNFMDYRRPENRLAIEPDGKGGTKLRINYAPPSDEQKSINYGIKKAKKFLMKLGAIVPPGQIHTRPMGASIHYSGTIPMSQNKTPFTVNSNCRSNDFDNLYFVDGTPLPFLPAKNLTFTLMANAARVADKEF